MSKLTQIWKRHIRPKLFWGETVRAPRISRNATDVVQDSCGVFASSPGLQNELLRPRMIVDPEGWLERFLEQHGPGCRTGAGQRYMREASIQEHTEFCLQLPGSVAGLDGAVIDPSGALVADVSGYALHDPSPLNPLRAGRLNIAKSVPNSLAVLTCWNSDNYYHWLVDGLARMRWLEPHFDSQTKIYAPRRKRFQRESLRLLGVSDEQLISASFGQHVSSPRILASSLQTHKCSKADVEFLYHRLAGGLERSATERLFLSRRRRGRRRIINESEVFSMLKPLGFRRVLLEKLTFQEQIQLFAAAECIVAPHGAGLANIVFANPRARVLEITTPYRLFGYHCFWQIAAHRELAYRALVSQPVSADEFDPNRGPGDSHIHASPTHVLESVEALMGCDESQSRLLKTA